MKIILSIQFYYFDYINPEIIKLNLEGEICPYTLIRTIKKVEKIKEDLELGRKKRTNRKIKSFFKKEAFRF